jgi:hypothetical protein
MTNTELISNSIEKYEIDLEKFENKKCFMCGKCINQGIKLKKIISGNFTNFNYAKCIESEYMCIECSTCIKNSDLVRKNFIADSKKIHFLSKNDIEEYIFNLEKYVESEFVVCLTKTFKKHNSFKACVNKSFDIFTIQLEDKQIKFYKKEFRKLHKMLNEAYLYFTKDDLESGNYNLLSIKDFGIEKTEIYENEFKKHRKTEYFNFLIWIMNSEKRNEIVNERLKLKRGK